MARDGDLSRSQTDSPPLESGTRAAPGVRRRGRTGTSSHRSQTPQRNQSTSFRGERLMATPLAGPLSAPSGLAPTHTPLRRRRRRVGGDRFGRRGRGHRRLSSRGRAAEREGLPIERPLPHSCGAAAAEVRERSVARSQPTAPLLLGAPGARRPRTDSRSGRWARSSGPRRSPLARARGCACGRRPRGRRACARSGRCAPSRARS